uniref:Uncharacterized protein n=1 Tax=Magallana gigas TaxID=29159 RepID=K1R6T9_MAGGI
MLPSLSLFHLKSESCINCLFISLELYTGGPSGMRLIYSSCLPYGLQRASTYTLDANIPSPRS